MPWPLLRRCPIAAILVPLGLVAAQAPAVAAWTCAAPRDWFLNPFTARSAQHRPIGTGARLAGPSHPATRDWLTARALAIGGQGADDPVVAATEAADPLRVVRPLNGCGPVSGLPITIRLPRAGVPLPATAAGSCAGWSVVVHDRVTGATHEFGQFRWGGGGPVARLHRGWDIRGLGHGIHPLRRIGLAPSGASALLGLLRGHEIDTPGRPIEHALLAVLPSRAGCRSLLSSEVVLPAVARDTAAERGGDTGHVPRGALLALPRTVDLAALRLSEPGRRLATALRDYGVYALDAGGCTAGRLRTDGAVRPATLARLSSDLARIYPHVRMVLNNDILAQAVAGGGTATAPNCAIDAR